MALPAPGDERGFGNAELSGDAAEAEAVDAKFQELISGVGGVHGFARV